MEVIGLAMRGMIEEVATLSFQCVMCGACAAKCPAEISQPNVALLARRLYGGRMLSLPEGLYQRISDIKKGRYKKVLERLIHMDVEDLMEVYTRREQEPQENHKKWIPKNLNFPGDMFSEERRPVEFSVEP